MLARQNLEDKLVCILLVTQWKKWIAIDVRQEKKNQYGMVEHGGDDFVLSFF
jgi:hypothetical protein